MNLQFITCTTAPRLHHGAKWCGAHPVSTAPRNMSLSLIMTVCGARCGAVFGEGHFLFPLITARMELGQSGTIKAMTGAENPWRCNWRISGMYWSTLARRLSRASLKKSLKSALCWSQCLRPELLFRAMGPSDDVRIVKVLPQPGLAQQPCHTRNSVWVPSLRVYGWVPIKVNSTPVFPVS